MNKEIALGFKVGFVFGAIMMLTVVSIADIVNYLW